MKNFVIRNVMKVCFVMMACLIKAAPVPVSDISCDPGFKPGAAATNRQTLAYIKAGGCGYKVTGAVCTECDSYYAWGGTTNDMPATAVAALSGAVITHIVIDARNGVKFDLGKTITNDSVGVVLGEIGSDSQTEGDWINVYPLRNGVRVGSWVRQIVAADYGLLNDKSFTVNRTDNNDQTLITFMTVFRRSDFTNDTGALTFDGIEINDNVNIDPNIVATIEEKVTAVTNKLPVTAMTFPPGLSRTPNSRGRC